MVPLYRQYKMSHLSEKHATVRMQTTGHLKSKFFVCSGNKAKRVALCEKNFAVKKNNIESRLLQLDVSRS